MGKINSLFRSKVHGEDGISRSGGHCPGSASCFC